MMKKDLNLLRLNPSLLICLLAFYFMSCSKGGHNFPSSPNNTNEGDFNNSGNNGGANEGSGDDSTDSREENDPFDFEGVIFGVCQPNLQETPNEVVRLAENVASVDIPLLRTDGVKSGGSIEQVVHDINEFAKKGISILLVQTLPWKAMYPEGYQPVPGPDWNVYEMSKIDLNRFEQALTQLLSVISKSIPSGSLFAFELFNEINWAQFNGDLQPNSSGKGIVFDLDTPLDDPSFIPFYEGMKKYRQCLKITRSVLDKQFPDHPVKLVTTGLVTGTKWNNHADVLKGKKSFVTPEMFLTLLQGIHPDQEDRGNYIKYADGIGIHMYPRVKSDMTTELRNAYFDPANSVLTAESKMKPFWVTEWGFRRSSYSGSNAEAERLKNINEVVEAFNTIDNIEVTTFFDFNGNVDYDIWEGGSLLKSGEFFQNVNK